MAERNVLLKNVKHPFLVGLHYSFQTTDKLYFVLDFVNGGEVSRFTFVNYAQNSHRNESQGQEQLRMAVKQEMCIKQLKFLRASVCESRVGDHKL